MLLCMIRIGDLVDEASMLVAVKQIGNAICEAIGSSNIYIKQQKMFNIAAKIEALRLKCVVERWQAPLTQLQECMELMSEASREFDSAKFQLKDIVRNAK